jgi:outer membrane protein OmpA-like peptidoglycan-associated protein
LIQNFTLLEFDFTTVFTLEGIYYDLDKANIRQDAAMILDTMVQLLNKYPKIRIELGSHTDCRADSAYNQDLSQRRADSAVAFISKKGIDIERMVAKGYGETALVNDCGCEGAYVKRKCIEEEHQLNRRTTFRLLDNKYIPKNKAEMKATNDKTLAPKGTKPGTTPPPRR